MSALAIILIVVLVIVVFGGVGTYSRGPYYGPGFGLVGLVILVLLVLVLVGAIRL